MPEPVNTALPAGTQPTSARPSRSSPVTYAFTVYSIWTCISFFKPVSPSSPSLWNARHTLAIVGVCASSLPLDYMPTPPPYRGRDNQGAVTKGHRSRPPYRQQAPNNTVRMTNHTKSGRVKATFRIVFTKIGMRFSIFRAFHSQFILRKGSLSLGLLDSQAQVKNFAF